MLLLFELELLKIVESVEGCGVVDEEDTEDNAAGDMDDVVDIEEPEVEDVSIPA